MPVRENNVFEKSNMTDRFDCWLICYLFREHVDGLESQDGLSGKYFDAVAALQKLEDQQRGVDISLKDNQDFLKQLSEDLAAMIDKSKGISIMNPHGKHL